MPIGRSGNADPFRIYPNLVVFQAALPVKRARTLVTIHSREPENENEGVNERLRAEKEILEILLTRSRCCS